MKESLGRRIQRQYRTHLISFAAGVLVGVMFADWLRSIVTILFVLVVLGAMYFIWVYFDKLKKQ